MHPPWVLCRNHTLARKPRSSADKFFLVPHGARRKHGRKVDIFKFQTDKQDGQTLEFGTVILPPRNAIREDKFDFVKFSDCTWSDVYVLAVVFA